MTERRGHRTTATAPDGADTARRQFRSVLLLIVVGALALRLAASLIATTPTAALRGDEVDYRSIAQDLVDGRGFTTDRRGPASPLLVAAAVAISGGTAADARDGGSAAVWIVRITQAAMGAATVALAGYIGRVIIGRRGGVWAAALLAVWPNELFIPHALLTESLFTLLITGGVALLVGGLRPSPARAAALGAVLGLAILTRGAAIPVLLVLVVVVFRSAGWRRAGLVVTAAAVVIAPWTISNLAAGRGPTISSGDAGFQLCIGNFPGEPPETWPPDPCETAPNARPDDAAMAADALRWRWHHPGTALSQLATRAQTMAVDDHWALFIAHFAPDDRRFGDTVYERGAQLFDLWWWALAALALGGAVTVRRHPAAPTLLATAIALLVAPVLVVADSRYRSPLDPLVAVVAAAGIVAATAIVRRRRAGALERAYEPPPVPAR